MGFATHSHESAMGVHAFPILNPLSHLPPHTIPLGHPSAPALSTLCHASNLDWWSVSHMIIYMFKCHSLRSSHPRLLPQSPKDCSRHLCLFCYLASADEWIRKLWYIYTMEYYSAIKKNTFESVLMRWMKLEPIIQSEVSQKEKHQHSILTHIYGI